MVPKEVTWQILFSLLCFLDWDNKNTVTTRIPARFPDCPFQHIPKQGLQRCGRRHISIKVVRWLLEAICECPTSGQILRTWPFFFGDGENMSMFNGCKRDLQRSGMQKVTTWELGEDIVDISLVLSGEVFATWWIGIVEIFLTQKVTDWKNHAGNGSKSCEPFACELWGEVCLLMFQA